MILHCTPDVVRDHDGAAREGGPYRGEMLLVLHCHHACDDQQVVFPFWRTMAREIGVGIVIVEELCAPPVPAQLDNVEREHYRVTRASSAFP